MSASPHPKSGEVTVLLRKLRQGDNEAERELIPLIYAELRLLATRMMGRERRDHTLQPTALVNETYLRIFKVEAIDYQSRAHFLAIAARIMRQILIDAARARGAEKRGGGLRRVDVDLIEVKGIERTLDVLVLDQALNSLKVSAPRPSQVVEMIFFGGMEMAEAAVVLEVSERTVKRDWATAKAWLYNEIYGGTDRVGQNQ